MGPEGKLPTPGIAWVDSVLGYYRDFVIPATGDNSPSARECRQHFHWNNLSMVSETLIHTAWKGGGRPD